MIQSTLSALNELLDEYVDEIDLNEWNMYLKGMPFFEQVLWLAKDIWTRKGLRSFSKDPYFALQRKVSQSGKVMIEEWLDCRRFST